MATRALKNAQAKLKAQQQQQQQQDVSPSTNLMPKTLSLHFHSISQAGPAGFLKSFF